MSWETVKLAEVTLINPRSPQLSDETEVSFVAMAAVSDLTQRVETEELRTFLEVKKGYTPFSRGDLLLAKITPCFENGKLAIADIEYEFGFGSTEFHVLRPDQSRLDTRYLYHFLRQKRILIEGEKKMTGSAGQRRVPKTFLELLEIPLPSLPIQKRIAAVLDEVDALRQKRERVIDKLEELRAASYLRLARQYESQSELVKVSELINPAKGGMRTGPFGSQLLHSEFVDDPTGIMVLGIDNAVKNRFQYAAQRYITPEKYAALKRYTVFPGDVLVTIMGTCGRVAIVPDDIPLAINTKHLCAMTLNERCLPAYLHAVLTYDPSVLHQMGASARGAIMDGLNMGIISGLQFRVPPLNVQKELQATFTEIDSLVNTALAAKQQESQLLHSLQTRAFASELSLR